MIVEIEEKRALELIDKMARFFVDRRMASAAIMTIESLKPINFIGSQLMYMVSPFAEIFFNSKEYQEIAALVENDDYVNLLSKRIDDLEEEYLEERRKSRKFLQRRKKNKIKNFLKKFLKNYKKDKINEKDRG